ncbi:MAG: glyoxalase [Bdellovibrionaceae bacterium]|nr:glyoxalase [Pseudobdellovibrionaceae bacterium]|tara:strand:+ start:9080 stop:9454 length:375 start_codon:yes stop_codon:yes gene_type:complete
MKLSAIGIVALNMEETLKFYENFGLKFNQISEDHYESVTESGVRLMIDSKNLILKLNPQWKFSNSSNIVLCFEKQTPDEVDKLFHSLVSKGSQSVKEPWNAFWGQRYATLKDPNGNLIDIFCDL